MSQLQSLSGILPSEILPPVILKTRLFFFVKFYNDCDWNKLDAIDLKVIGLLTHLSTCTNNKLSSPTDGELFRHKEIKNIKASFKNHTSRAWIDTKIELTFLLLLLLLLLLYYYRISHFSAWLWNIHLCWDVVINRIRLGGLICSLKSFLQLNMCQELQIFAVVYMHSGAS